MFSGRGHELLTIEQALFQTKEGNPNHFLIRGERGIGKSSLLLYVQLVANGGISPEPVNFNFLTLSVELEPSNTYSDIVEKIGSELHKVVASKKPATELAKTGWQFLTRWEVMGVKYSSEPKKLKPLQLLDDLVDAFDKTVSGLGTEMDGIILLLDEADKPAVDANLGQFLKLFTERLTKRGCHRVCIGLAGIPTLLQRLKQSHESSTRIFEIMTLEPLLPEERVRVIERGLAKAKEKNGVETRITDDAKETISDLSEGYPHFIQQFAYCAFNEDTDNVIDMNDVREGALNTEKGAIQQLGLKYFQDLYFEQIGSDEYREVLRAMAENLDEWVSKADLRKAVRVKASTLDNAISALRKRHIILDKPGTAGVYRLPTKSFAVWIKAFTRASAEPPTPEAPQQTPEP